MTEWQPIESAPKNGDSILLASDHGHVTVGRWYRHIPGWATEMGTFHEGTTVAGKPCRISHWMHLPDPPAPPKGSIKFDQWKGVPGVGH